MKNAGTKLFQHTNAINILIPFSGAFTGNHQKILKVGFLLFIICIKVIIDVKVGRGVAFIIKFCAQLRQLECMAGLCTNVYNVIIHLKFSRSIFSNANCSEL